MKMKLDVQLFASGGYDQVNLEVSYEKIGNPVNSVKVIINSIGEFAAPISDEYTEWNYENDDKTVWFITENNLNFNYRIYTIDRQSQFVNVVVNDINKITICIDQQNKENPTENIREHPLFLFEPLRTFANQSDRLIIDEKGIVKVIRRIKKIDDYLVLIDDIEETYENIILELFDGINYIYLKDIDEYSLKVKYLKKNDLSNSFVNKIEFDSKISQTSNEIILEVSAKYTGKGEIIATINMTPEGVKIQADKIDITGVLSVLATNGSTVINGSNITTGQINANLITVGNLNADRLYGGTIIGSSINLGGGTFTVGTNGAANCSNINATGGRIGGLTLESTKIYVNDSGISSNTSEYAFWAGETNGVKGAGSSNAKFKVGHDGIMQSSGAIVSGTITANAGSIGGWNISSNSLYAYGSNATSYLYSNGNVVFGGNYGMLKFDTNPVRITTAGKLLISDSYGANELPSTNDTVAIRCYSGTLHLNSNYGVYANSTLLASGSSRKMKKNIKQLTVMQIDEIYAAVKNLKSYKYDYKKKYSGGQLNNYGFIIEDFEKGILGQVLHVVPGIDDTNTKYYSKDDLTQLNTILIQELMKKIEFLESRC